MGFFDKLLGHDWEWYVKRSDKCVKDADLGEAMRCLKEAKELAGDNETAQKEVTSHIEDLKHTIFKQAYEQARSYLRSHNHEAAQNAFDRAARHVQSDEERDALNELMEDGQKWDEEEKIIEAKVEGEDRVDTLGVDDKWNLYVTSLPFDKAQHYDDLGDEFKEAWIKLQEGNFDGAIEGLEKVYKKHDDDPYVMTELGRAYYGKGDFEKAHALLLKADQTRDDIDTKLLRVEILWAMKRFDAAEEVLQAAHDMDPDNNTVLARIAQHGLIANDLESGIAAIEVLLEKLPQDISVQRLGGRIYLESGDEDKALECFETVNRLFWQVNPQTKKITFDQNSAAAAAALYVKRNENLPRAIELLDAVRANSTGETHVAICMQLADIYEKMSKKGKRDELLTESMRFMEDMFETVKGPELAMVKLQYADVADRIGDSAKCDEMLDEARSIFAPDAAGGHPVAAFYLDIIDRKKAGEPFPKGSEMQERLESFVKEHMQQPNMSRMQPSSQTIEADDDNVILDSGAQSASIQITSMSQNEDAMRAMAALAGQMQMSQIRVSSDGEVESDEEEDSEEDEPSSEDK